MKCDVCQTTIPLGSDRCPNCGYKIPKSKGIHSSTLKDEVDSYSEFDHIKPVFKKTVLNDIERVKPLRKTNTGIRRKSKRISLGSIIIGLIIFCIIYVGCAYMIPLYFDQEYLPTPTDLSIVYDDIDGLELTNPNVDRTMFQSYSLDFNDEYKDDLDYFPLGMTLYMVPTGLMSDLFENIEMNYGNYQYDSGDYYMRSLQYDDYAYGGILYQNDEITIFFKYQEDKYATYSTSMETDFDQLHYLMVDKIENGYTTD